MHNNIKQSSQVFLDLIIWIMSQFLKVIFLYNLYSWARQSGLQNSSSVEHQLWIASTIVGFCLMSSNLWAPSLYCMWIHSINSKEHLVGRTDTSSTSLTKQFSQHHFIIACNYLQIQYGICFIYTSWVHQLL